MSTYSRPPKVLGADAGIPSPLSGTDKSPGDHLSLKNARAPTYSVRFDVLTDGCFHVDGEIAASRALVWPTLDVGSKEPAAVMDDERIRSDTSVADFVEVDVLFFFFFCFLADLVAVALEGEEEGDSLEESSPLSEEEGLAFFLVASFDSLDFSTRSS